MTDWQEFAACAADDVEPDWFFPDVPGLAGNKAKGICNGCLVKDPCLQYALHRPVSGIWGGTTEPQRVKLRQERGIQLPSGWTARQKLTSWERRYREMRELGYDDLEIAWRWNVKPESLARQMHRYKLTPSERLLAEVNRIKAEKAAS